MANIEALPPQVPVSLGQGSSICVCVLFPWWLLWPCKLPPPLLSGRMRISVLLLWSCKNWQRACRTLSLWVYWWTVARP
jgi:hypothetical protein